MKNTKISPVPYSESEMHSDRVRTMPADQGFSLHCWPAISRQLAEEIGTAKLFREHIMIAIGFEKARTLEMKNEL